MNTSGEAATLIGYRHAEKNRNEKQRIKLRHDL